MVIYLNPRENYWLDPIQQGFSRGVSLGLQEAIRRKREEEKIRQATEIAQSLVDEVDDISPTNTYITDTPDYTIEEQSIDPFKETRERFGVREKLREGLLSSGAMKEALKLDTPKTSSITDVMKSPMEYMREVYKKTAPLLAKGAVLGLDMSDIVSSRIKSYEEAYKAKEEEAKRLREIQRKVKSNYTKVGLVFKKYGKEIDPETQAQLAVAMAYGDITRDDLKMMVAGKYKAITMEDPSGNKRFMVFDQETGEVVKEKVYEFDMDLFERKEKVKAKYKSKKEGGRGNKLQKAPVKVPTLAYKNAVESGDTNTAMMLEMSGNAFKSLYFLFDPATGRYFTPNKRLPVNPNDPEDVERKLRLDKDPVPKQKTKSILDLFPDLKR